MGVDVQGLCTSLKSGIYFIRWYMGGHAMRACRVWSSELKDKKITDTRCLINSVTLSQLKLWKNWGQKKRIQHWYSTSFPCLSVLVVAKTLACVSTSHSRLFLMEGEKIHHAWERINMMSATSEYGWRVVHHLRCASCDWCTWSFLGQNEEFLCHA